MVGVRVMPSGRKTYVARYRTQSGTERLQKIARVTDIPIEAARAEAVRLFEAVHRGNDPLKERRAVRHPERLCDVWERYIAEARAYKKPKSVEFYSIQWRVHLSDRFGKMKAEEITSDDVKQFMIDYQVKKPTANNSLQTLKSILNFAKVKNNPCLKVSMYKINRQPRILSAAELKRIWEGLETFTDHFALLIKLLILTGARKNEIMKSRTEWVDLERKTITLPDSKTGAKIIQLPKSACELLKDCHSRKWIIQEPFTDLPLQHPSVSMRRLWQVTGIKFKLKDLRSTYASRASRKGVSIREIATLLGHRQLRTTSRYIHNFDDSDGRNPVEIAATAMT